MGHYASEMQCDTCGKLRCVCPPPPDLTANQWVVTDDFTVMRALDFQNKPEHGSFGFFNRMQRKHFTNRKMAETAARLECEAAVELARERLAELKKICKVIRPWAKK